MAVRPGAKTRLDLFGRMLPVRRFGEPDVEIRPRQRDMGGRHPTTGHEAIAASVGAATRRSHP